MISNLKNLKGQAIKLTRKTVFSGKNRKFQPKIVLDSRHRQWFCAWIHNTEIGYGPGFITQTMVLRLDS